MGFNYQGKNYNWLNCFEFFSSDNDVTMAICTFLETFSIKYFPVNCQQNTMFRAKEPNAVGVVGDIKIPVAKTL